MPHKDLEARRLYLRNWRERNRDNINRVQREYRARNLEDVRLRSRESAYKRYWEDEEVRQRVITNSKVQGSKKLQTVKGRLEHNLRSRLYQAVRKSYKSGSAVSDLGCSIDEFKLYIENQFDGGMTWDNYGKVWELDHVQPLVTFDLSNRMEFLEACHWLNIRPMTVGENRSRANR